MKLTETDKNRIINNRKPTIDINGKRYFSKIGIFQMDGVSLVVEKLADLVGIKSAHIERHLIDDVPYYLSEDLRSAEDARFESAMYSIRFANTLNEMCDALQDNYREQTVFLIDKVIKMYMFDALVMNSDRNYSNWGFLYGEKGIIDLVILDNELCFVPRSISPESSYTMSFNESNRDQREDLFEFLDSSYTNHQDTYYKEMLAAMCDVLTPEVVAKAFSEVEEENDMRIALKNIFLNNYRTNYSAICERLRGKSK